MKTIVALSTPPMRSAVAVVRLSGNKAFSICEKVFFSAKKLTPRTMTLGQIKCGDIVDKGLVVLFPAPNSYTGEDMVEFHCHGSIAVTDALIKECVRLGANYAQNGEFTKQAYLNGKLDLSEAEGIIDLIDSETKAQAKAAFEQTQGSVFLEISKLQDKLTDCLAAIEVALDYPEDDIEKIQTQTVYDQSKQALEQINQLINSFSSGKMIRGGVNVVVCGAVNAGKSSLINALLGQDRVIVSDTAGTTRDTVTESYEYKGIKFSITDTAGLNDNPDTVEKMGIERALRAASEADIIVWLFERAQEYQGGQQYTNAPVIRAGSKADIVNHQKADIQISAKTGQNIQALKEMIYKQTIGKAHKISGTVITSQRHYNALCAAKQALQNAIESIQRKNSIDCAAFDINQSWQALGEITGITASEEIINAVFSRFCVGK